MEGQLLKKPRNLGIDLLRAVSMLMVIVLHLVGNGGIVAACEQGSVKYYALSMIHMLSYCAVNLYGITSGYVMCQGRFRLSKIVKLWATTVFWGVTVSCLFVVWEPEAFSIKELISAFLPLLRGRYWFFTAYFVVYMVSPVLNHVIRTLPKRTFQLLLLALFLIFGIIPAGALGNDVLRISGGHHMVWLLVLYLIGGYLRIHMDARNCRLARLKPRVYLAGYFLFGLLHLLYKICAEGLGSVLFGIATLGNIFLTYPSPFIVGEAVCLFLYFKDAFTGLRQDGAVAKVIGFATPGVFSVYLIHVHPLVFWRMIADGFTGWADWFLPAILAALVGLSAALFAACILLDALRQRLFKLLRIDNLLESTSDKTETVIRNLLKG